MAATCTRSTSPFSRRPAAAMASPSRIQPSVAPPSTPPSPHRAGHCAGGRGFPRAADARQGHAQAAGAFCGVADPWRAQPREDRVDRAGRQGARADLETILRQPIHTEDTEWLGKRLDGGNKAAERARTLTARYAAGSVTP